MTYDVLSLLPGFPVATFNQSFIGADKLLQSIATALDCPKGILGYPPYNIIKVDDNKYVIEMAVAGFGKQNIDIEMANNTLTVKGGLTLDQLDPASPVNYIYKGLADRSFTRTFSIADSIEVKNAELFNGVLKIWLENLLPDAKKPKKIDIVDNSVSETKVLK